MAFLRQQALVVQTLIQLLGKTRNVKANHGNHGNDRNDGNGGGGGVEKKKKEDEGNGGGEMKYPAGQSRFGQFSYGKGCRHSYGYQNGPLKTGEKNVYCVGSRHVKRDRPNTARVKPV